MTNNRKFLLAILVAAGLVAGIDPSLVISIGQSIIPVEGVIQ